jgi:hypothetical protein
MPKKPKTAAVDRSSTDAIALLMNDHQEVKQLFEKYEARGIER